MTSDDVRNLIIDLRGGLPPRCDFCHKETPPDELHPEEGGLWHCMECYERWEKSPEGLGY